MIQKFEQYNESLRDKMTGKSDEEVKKLLDTLSPIDKIKKGIELKSTDIIDKGIRELKKGDINQEDIKSFIDTAIYNEYLDVIKFLIENLEIEQEFYSIIQWSLEMKYKNTHGEKNKSLLSLIDWVAEKELEQLNNKKDYNKILSYGCEHNDFDMVKKAIKNGADVNYSEWGVLRKPINNGNLEMVEYLLKQGSKMVIPGHHPTALESAINSNNIEMTKLLLKYGANLGKNYMVGANQIVNWIEEDSHKEIIEYLGDMIPGIKEEIEKTIERANKVIKKEQDKIDKLRNYL